MSVAQSNEPSADNGGGNPAPASAPASHDPFAKLAKWYDILHSSKNYNADSLLYAKHLGAKPGDTVIEWGCGTGEFTRRFAAMGYSAYGVDCSREMIDIAVSKGCDTASNPPLFVEWSLTKHFALGGLMRPNGIPRGDAACATFATISYSGATNDGLLRSFRQVRSRLCRGGRFVFDVIHAAAAAAELRADEIKEGERDGIRVKEHRRKTFRPNNCIVEIQAETMAIECETGRVIETLPPATHLMRAFSPPELQLALKQCEFRVVDIFAPWSNAGADEAAKIQVGDYYLMVVAEAV